jgi:hypothetical protein
VNRGQSNTSAIPRNAKHAVEQALEPTKSTSPPPSHKLPSSTCQLLESVVSLLLRRINLLPRSRRLDISFSVPGPAFFGDRARGAANLRSTEFHRFRVYGGEPHWGGEVPPGPPSNRCVKSHAGGQSTTDRVLHCKRLGRQEGPQTGELAWGSAKEELGWGSSKEEAEMTKVPDVTVQLVSEAFNVTIQYPTAGSPGEYCMCE